MENTKKQHFGLIMVVYLLGIFMGALDTGIVTPARTVIQSNLMVDDKLGIWMITIYTLAYAASIPVMGKFADRNGRKNIYLLSIFLFAIGSLFCGLSQQFESFPLLLGARAIQAIGGGGIVPVATAEFGTTFPAEKRGMALGLVGGVFGIANVFGASVGSGILDIFGAENWQYIFYINLPISVFILAAGIFVLPNTKERSVKKIDGLGILVLTGMVLALMYGLKNIDFFDFLKTVSSKEVFPFLLFSILLIPLFIFLEKRAEDPVMNLSYFKNKRIIITLLLSIITGVVLMGVIFIPQFCENAMKMAAGSGGYFVIILGVFAGIGAPLSGNLIDRYGAKVVLLLGFGTSIAGAVFLIFVTTNSPTMVTVILCLILLGTGMGFTMGTPLNYMMLEETSRKEANSALATLSLVRSMGTVIAPAIMVGFIAHAGMAVQGNIMDLLPKTVDAPGMPGNQMEINLSGSSESIPKDLLELMQGSDVTTVVENSKTFAGAMFDQMETRLSGKLPPAAAEAMEKSFALSKEKYLNAIDEKSDIIETEFQKTLNVGFKQIYGTVGISSLVGVVLLLFYRRKKKEL